MRRDLECENKMHQLMRSVKRLLNAILIEFIGRFS